MAIGTSDGEYFDDEFSHLVDQKPVIKTSAEDNFTPLSEEEIKSLQYDTPMISHKGAYDPVDPTLTAKDIDEMLNQTEYDKLTEFQRYEKMYGKGHVIPNNPLPAGRLQGREDVPAFQEYLKNLPKDVTAHRLKDGFMMFMKKQPPENTFIGM